MNTVSRFALLFTLALPLSCASRSHKGQRGGPGDIHAMAMTAGQDSKGRARDASTICNCPSENSKQPFQGETQDDGSRIHFVWSSDVDECDGQYRYERKVVNHHKTATLRFDWPVGRLSAYSLPPNNGLSRTCGAYGPPHLKEGPLSYGRGGKKTATKVYEGDNEPKTALSTYLEADVMVSGMRIRIILLVESAVVPTAAGNRYEYVVSNLSTEAPIVAVWESPQSDYFAKAMAKQHKQADMFKLAELDKIGAHFDRNASPVVINQKLHVLGPTGEIILSTVAPAYVPTP